MEALNALRCGECSRLEPQCSEAGHLLSHREPVDDFPRDQRREEGSFGRGVHKPDEPYHSVQQAYIQGAYADGPHIGMVLREG